MASWTQRTTAPAYNNPWYINNNYGGYNYCIVINGSTGSVLPNCVGYAWGRFCEGAGITYCNLSRGNAENWWGNTGDGYSRGQTPAVGAVVCYYGVGNYKGHVEVVEQVNADGSFITSASNYSGTRWYRSTRYTGRNLGSNLTWQGFIYNPYINGATPPAPDPDQPGQDDPTGYLEISNLIGMYNIMRKKKRRLKIK